MALLKYKTTTNPLDPFAYIDSPLIINKLVATSSGGGGGGGGGSSGGGAGQTLGGALGGDGAGPGGPGATSNSARSEEWIGLGTVYGSGAAGHFGGETGGAASGRPGANATGGDQAGSVAAERAVDRKRTEFIIVMYWVEPLPTEPDEAKAPMPATTTPTK